MRVPSATYRLQLNQSFTFDEARRLVPYLHELGISHLYLSPIFKAAPGSTHGYDVVDPNEINPELGGEAGFDALVEAVHGHGMGILLDIVPNHMAAQTANPWWCDVLESGTASPYACFFDLRLRDAGDAARLQLPVLGDDYRHVLERGELELDFDEKGFGVRYWQQRLPVDPSSYSFILAHCGTDAPALGEVAVGSKALPGRDEQSAGGKRERQGQIGRLKRRLWSLYQGAGSDRRAIDRALAQFKGRPGNPDSFAPLDDLLSRQFYRLIHWRQAPANVSYRRFFDNAGLVALRADEPEVFHATHRLVVSLINSAKVDGLRIDHLDGIRDPRRYLELLQGAVSRDGQETYIVAEKILGRDEGLPADWPLSGTTGYEFSAAAEAALVSAAGLRRLDASYRELTRVEKAFSGVDYECKREVIARLFPGDLTALTRRLAALIPPNIGLNREALQEAIAAVSACLSVYRTYVSRSGISPQDRARIELAFAEAERRNPALDGDALAFLRDVLTLELHPASVGLKAAYLDFVERWQQFTTAVAAKGGEDTAFFRYNRLISMNEVGGEPGADLREAVSDLHETLKSRAARGWQGLNATSTHDSKRSEDVRARLAILSELPEEFGAAYASWRDLNSRYRHETGDEEAPTTNEEWYIYQTMLGAWPLDPSEVPDFRGRLRDHMTKAMREAKEHSSWLERNENHEAAVLAFADAITAEDATGPFMSSFLALQDKVARYGWLQSLSLLLLKLAAPGVPDFYQGNELWDFSLTDPDNRRPVDFDRRQALFAGAKTLGGVLYDWRDGRAKLLLTARSLACRAAHPDLFEKGDYQELAVTGIRAEHLIAFARRWEGEWLIALAPRLLVSLLGDTLLPTGPDVWQDGAVILPPGAPRHWHNAVTGEEIETASSAPSIASCLADFPVALLYGRASNRPGSASRKRSDVS